ncbi:hypothetical protein [Desulfovirgula thermocuniculi]|uniref:hypothetical protein n=1 Tax=Desulfovirgula thermocuniculi TaxID=348842 RepID=UPI0003F9F7B2|nr:hypothetical protein [Desulfovirgula thermocuniculi]
MLKTMEKILLAGIGALSLACERASRAVNDLAAIGHATRWEAYRRFEELSARGEKEKKHLQEYLLKDVLAEIEAIKERLARLEENLPPSGHQQTKI